MNSLTQSYWGHEASKPGCALQETADHFES